MPDEWRARFAVFAVSETQARGHHRAAPGHAPASRSTSRDVTLTTEDLVAATNGRLSPEHPLDPALRAALNVVGS